MSKLWDYDFEICKNQEEFLKILAKYPGYNAEYLVAACRPEFRERVEKYWSIHSKFADSHFPQQLKKGDFITRSWEMFMSYLFTEEGFQLSSNNEGPDLIINNSIYIECVASKKGEGKDKVTNHEIRNQISFFTIEEEKMILRITNSIREKVYTQYEGWVKKKWFNHNLPYVIALSAADITGQQLIYSDRDDIDGKKIFLSPLFGLGQATFNIRTKESSYLPRPFIKKQDGGIIYCNIFETEEYSAVSAIIFCNDYILSKEYEDIKDLMFIVHNPFAKNPLDKNTFSFIEQWIANEKEIERIIPKNS